MFQLRLLGTPSIKDQHGVTPPSLGWGKPLALLALLAVRGEARRDEIVDLLWRDVEESKARNAFRQALHRLRSALGEQIIPQDREILRLVPGTSLDIDLRAFEAAVAAGRVTDALDRFGGDFLQDAVLDEPAFDQWADAERLRLRARYRGALDAAVAAAQAAGDWTRAIELSRILVEVAPLDESAARTAALARLSAGRGAEARDVLVRFGARLQSELGLTLPPELQAMLTRLDRAADVPTSHGAAAPEATLAFAGRESELSRLLALWRATGDDAGTLALIEGEEGVGKSRLVRELTAHARSLRGATVLTGREYPGTSHIPFVSIADALRPLVRASGVAGASRHLLAEASRLLPELRDTFELPALAHIEDEAARVRFFEGVAALVDAAAYERPVLLVLEDVHHAAPSTLDLLSYLAARLAGSAVMFVLTARGGGTAVARARALASGRAESPRVSLLTLAPLDATAMSDALAGMDLPADVRARVAAAAKGVPGRALELVRRARAGDSLAPAPVPLRTLLQERLSALSSSHRRTFLVVALLGRPASIASLAGMAHLTDAAALETIDALGALDLLVRTGELVEAHPLAAETALDAAGGASRAFLAGWIADALTDDPRANPGEIARFNAMAGRARETFAAARRAAFAAMHVGAWPEAVQYLQAARSVAGDRELAEIEGMLAALGAGKPRIAATPVDAPAVASATPETAPAAVAGVDAPLPWRERWFPNWRILFGAALGTLVISAIVMSRAPAGVVAPPTDTLVLADGTDGRTARIATGGLVAGFSLLAAEFRDEAPAWDDSLARRHPDVVQARGRALGASPDGRWLLVAAPRGDASTGSDVDLFAIHRDGAARVALDTVTGRSVTEAAWSPDGSRVAWVVRLGEERQQELFVAFADGSGADNVSRHPADDYHLAWSGDGELLGFTSTRDGNPELYAFGVQERRLWRLTRDPAQDDWARFSANGRLVAFESTRGGESGVYVMAALGGEAVRVGQGASLSVRSWRGVPRYLDRVRVETAPVSPDTVVLRVAGLDQSGNPMDVAGAQLRLLDGERAFLAPTRDSTGYLVAGRGPGLVRVVASIGGWRVDTALVRLGSAPIALASGPPDAPDWRPLGEPRPLARTDGVLLRADGEGESGLLSAVVAPMLPGLELTGEFAGFDATTMQRASVSIALVAPEQPDVIDAGAPVFLRHVSATWDGDARRMIFAVGREVHAEQALPAAVATLRLLLRVEPDSTVSFHVGGEQRWRSTLRVDQRGARRVQSWIAGRSTGAIRVTRAELVLGRVSTP